MNHWIVAPVLLPAVLGALIVLIARFDPVLQRRLSVLGCSLGLLLALCLFMTVLRQPALAYRLGDWPAPFGIVLVLDPLAAMMLLLSAILGLAVAGYAAGREDENGPHFHALLQFQLMGLNGAFLTGDLFNLFVFFEILLIASYGLMLHGGGEARFRNGFHYVVINLVGALVFLIGAGLIYGVTGTLNLADLALKAPLVESGDAALFRLGGICLLIVFGLKAALVPFHFWLPGTYRSTSFTSAAMFAILTKVGAYAIIRASTLVFGFGGGAAAHLFTPYLLPAALLTSGLGLLALPGARSLGTLAAFAMLGSSGTLFVGLATDESAGLAASLYYLVHSTLAGAAFYLLADRLVDRSGGRFGPQGDRILPRLAEGQGRATAAAFMLLAVMIAGLPPFSGFLGKIFILQAVLGAALAPALQGLVLAVVLLGSFFAMAGFTRAGVLLFWQPAPATDEPPPRQSVGGVWAIGGLMAALLALTVAAGPSLAFFERTANLLLAPEAYVSAVLGQHVQAPPAEEP
ncbi:multisubunit potassium/proton antiporter, PhaD subunit [Arboricoccus pini]|uniref:Multisubunit potassium/proton antiporter, PhaD subunit n=1 Tax=Arboricoccus pini TaxID=1963835 RepID=A0A212Q375_9PROT|nr:monovalent cation/H+ antiporter subunit D [Arboricoccus pini]SNB53618.1 multisubunit potassium/proton antiporter, PhaD subunit [Arboricoccus pini]